MAGDLREMADKTTCPWGCEDVVYFASTDEWEVVSDDDPYCGTRPIRVCPFCGGLLATKPEIK